MIFCLIQKRRANTTVGMTWIMQVMAVGAITPFKAFTSILEDEDKLIHERLTTTYLGTIYWNTILKK